MVARGARDAQLVFSSRCLVRAVDKNHYRPDYATSTYLTLSFFNLKLHFMHTWNSVCIQSFSGNRWCFTHLRTVMVFHTLRSNQTTCFEPYKDESMERNAVNFPDAC